MQKWYYSLYDEWYKQYNIPEKNQLIFEADDVYQWKLEIVNSNKQRSQNIEINKYFIFDNRNLIILNEENCRKFDNKHDTFQNISNHKIMILEYFDIKKQKTKIVQIIL